MSARLPAAPLLVLAIAGALAACDAERGPVFGAPAGGAAAAGEVVRLHPENPHYFLFQGRPTVLLTSGEHWGAVMNLDFDYAAYLEKLRAAGLNYTRVMSGAISYRPDTAQPELDPQAPRPGRLITPWRRVSGGGGEPDRFDLAQWDPAYFLRLKDFVAQAARRGIVVEYVFFRRASEMRGYVSPMHASQNVNGVGNVDWLQLDVVSEPALLEAQLALVRKVVGELAELGNLFYNVSHASNDGPPGLAWQERIVAAIREAEAALPRRHLVAANHGDPAAIGRLGPARSILLGYFPRHMYQLGTLDLLEGYYSLDRVIGMGKDHGFGTSGGFDGMSLEEVRATAWETVFAGGALYNNKNLDYTVLDPTGDTPRSNEVRRQLRMLLDFVRSFDVARTSPRRDLIRGGVPAGGQARLLAEAGRQYLFYVHHAPPGGFERSRLVPQPGTYGLQLQLELQAGSYRAEWIDPATLEVKRTEMVSHAGGPRTLASPPYMFDLALRLR